MQLRCAGWGGCEGVALSHRGRSLIPGASPQPQRVGRQWISDEVQRIRASGRQRSGRRAILRGLVASLARGKRRRVLLPLAIMLVGLALSLLLAFAVNVASSLEHWPGWFDLIRRHSFRAIAVIMVATGGLAAIPILTDRSKPEPATSDEVCASAGEIKAHIDRVAFSAQDKDSLIERLPPYPRELLLRGGGDEGALWWVVKAFAESTADPYVVAREWAASAPQQLEALSAEGRLLVAELLHAYDQTRSAVTQMRAAVRMGVAPRTFWLVRAASFVRFLDGDDAAEAADLLDQAAAIDAEYPMLTAVRAADAQQWQAAEDTLRGWGPQALWEIEARSAFRATVLARLGQLDEAIAVLREAAVDTRNAGLLIQLAQLLAQRSMRSSGDSRWADALEGLNAALRARNLRRAWRGPSAEAVAVAADAALTADDPQRAWTITRPAPQGEASEREAADGNVLVVAALAGALTGRTDVARGLADQTEDPYQRARIEAELAGAEGGGAAAVEAWQKVHTAATRDDQKLEALDRMAKDGFLDRQALSALSAQYPDAAEAIELDYAIMSVTGPDADEKLRGWERSSALASVRRADLARRESPTRAAEILIDATDQYHDPRLLRMAIDCYADAGEWELAEDLAEQTLVEGGALWPGRTDVLRRLLMITIATRDWPKVARTARDLLELDTHDEDARWSLTIAQAHCGEMDEAWHTLNRHGPVITATTAGRAVYLLELARRFADAERVARTALKAVEAFPDDQVVHAAALNALALGPDMSALGEQISGEITATWSSFLERYPDSRYFSAFALQEGHNPFAEIEATMRAHAQGFEKILAAIRDQQLPLGMLERFSGKPYAASFLYRPLGYHHAGSAAQADIDYELDVARSARERPVLIDASALYTLALIPDIAPALIALTHRTAVTDVSLRDLIASDDHFNVPSNWSMEFDHAHDRIVVAEKPAAMIERQRTLIRAMLDTARTLRHITRPALKHPQLMRELERGADRESSWRFTLDAAKETGALVWSDDVGLRRFAFGIGVKSFGTLSLIALAHGHGRIDDTELQTINRALIREYVVDLPFDLPTLEATATAEGWIAGGVAFTLTRPATWNDLGTAESLFHHAMRNAPEPHLAQWVYAAMTGLCTVSASANRDTNLTIATTKVLCENWSRPEHAEALASALTALVPDTAPSIIRAGLDNTWKSLRRIHNKTEAAIVFRHLLSHLQDAHRQHGASLIADPAS